ncbi:MAG: S8 family peptidase [bacterium]
MDEIRLRHIFLSDSRKSIAFTNRPGRGRLKIPPRDRASHGERLKRLFENQWAEAERNAVAIESREGVYIEFQSREGFDLITKSLEDRRSGVRLLSVRQEGEAKITYATVFIPANRKGTFLKKINQYLLENTPTGKPKNSDFIASIEDIQLAVVKSFWLDQAALMPGDEAQWCEVWLSSDEDAVETRFRKLLHDLDIAAGEGSLYFPDRTVILIRASYTDLMHLIERSPDIAEFRLAKETCRFWMELEPPEQSAWVLELLSRLHVNQNTDVSISVLDTGANNGHPLLRPILSDSDCMTCNSEWDSGDHDGHGTRMCGISGYGNLQERLSSLEPVKINHKLESVKILPRDGKNPEYLWGYITQQAVYRAEIQNPSHHRIHCMAITSPDNRDRGRPSSWSAAIDALTSGYDDDHRRLLILSCGNVELQELKNYPSSNLTDGIHDPAQSWNALTVGAYTEKTIITDPDMSGYEPLAPSGGLSPFSSTSVVWDNKWPIKPEIVLEGGNAATDPGGFCTVCDDLSLLTTSYLPAQRSFHIMNGTSAACAQAAWMAAQIQATYPNAWPETIRALLVHSAQWTETLKRQFLDDETKKTCFTKLLRTCGYGVPNLQQALYCGKHYLTLITQEEIQPFDKCQESHNIKTKEMHLYELPWPRETLINLGEIPVQLRVTLSYFIEPSPGERGWQNKYRYPSHGLRFDLNKPTETPEEFKKRVNKEVREEKEESISDSGSQRWLLGKQNRDKGSIQSDIWTGTAADIACCNFIGIYPIIGWWKERHYLGRWGRKARYTLIVSLQTPEQLVDIDIYTPVAVQLKVPVIIVE